MLSRLFKELSVSLMKDDIVLESKAIHDKNKICNFVKILDQLGD